MVNKLFLFLLITSYSHGIRKLRISIFLKFLCLLYFQSKHINEQALYCMIFKHFPVDAGRKLNVHKTFRKRPGRLLNVLCAFSLRPVSMGLCAASILQIIHMKLATFRAMLLFCFGHSRIKLSI